MCCPKPTNLSFSTPWADWRPDEMTTAGPSELHQLGLHLDAMRSTAQPLVTDADAHGAVLISHNRRQPSSGPRAERLELRCCRGRRMKARTQRSGLSAASVHKRTMPGDDRAPFELLVDSISLSRVDFDVVELSLVIRSVFFGGAVVGYGCSGGEEKAHGAQQATVVDGLACDRRPLLVPGPHLIFGSSDLFTRWVPLARRKSLQPSSRSDSSKP